MGEIIKKSEVKRFFPRRRPDSHKGENGRVLIIGGSLDYFGAPILAALGALGSGADLVYLLVPECNFEITRSYYPDFIVRKYPGNFLTGRAVDPALALAEKADAILIGPGISEDSDMLGAITKIIQKTQCPIVLDAEAIPVIAQLGLPESFNKKSGAQNISRLTITPHRAEMDQLTEGALPDDPEEEAALVMDFAKKWNVNILLKGPHDKIAAPEKPLRVNETGNAGMTVGGTGDVLAGVVASLIAQKCPPYEACVCAAYLVGLAGDNLLNIKGYNFTATDTVLELPYTIHRVMG